MFSRNALDIWRAHNLSLTLLKQKGFFSFWVYKAAPLEKNWTDFKTNERKMF